MTFSPFLVANARHVARDDADRVPLAALAGSTGAVGIFVGRHGRIRADSRDSARSFRFATSSGSYLLGRSPDRTEEDGPILQWSLFASTLVQRAASALTRARSIGTSCRSNQE